MQILQWADIMRSYQQPYVLRPYIRTLLLIRFRRGRFDLVQALMKRSNGDTFFFDLLPSPFILVNLLPFSNFLPSLYSHIVLSRLDMKANALLSSATRFKDHNELLEVSTLQTSVHYGTANKSSFKTSPERRGQGAFHKALTGTGITGFFMGPLCEYYPNYN